MQKDGAISLRYALSFIILLNSDKDTSFFRPVSTYLWAGNSTSPNYHFVS
jgi:hypothetical protein